MDAVARQPLLQYSEEDLAALRQRLKAEPRCWLWAKGRADRVGDSALNMLLSYQRARNALEFVDPGGTLRQITSALGEEFAPLGPDIGELNYEERRADLYLLCPRTDQRAERSGHSLPSVGDPTSSSPE